MQSRVLQRVAVAAVLVLGAAVSAVSTAVARPVLPGPRARSAFNLFAGAVNLSLVGNRVQCNLTNFGNICTNPYGSGTIEGGFWPAGAPDAYVFNGGLQVGATVLYDPLVNGQSSGPWQNDTVGVFFMDPRGPQRMGEGLTNVYSGLNASDLAVWPDAGTIQDTSLYNAALIGQKTISQQDTWVRYWDGNPNIGTGRSHTMGVLVEQRGLLWNTVGQEDILFFLERFINITATDPTMYAGLATAGYTPAEINDIVAVAQNFHNNAKATFSVDLPAKGYTFHNMFAAFFQDPDLGNQNDHNFSSAILPFATTAVMKSNYYEPLWSYPGYLFSPPFAAAPGFEAVKYLKSPINPVTGKQFGISMWGNTTNGGAFPDAVGVQQMYRYISGHTSPALGDGACNSPNVALDHTCNAVQSYADTRFYMSSGPFDLAPGQSSVIVVAMIFAAPMATMPATTNGVYSMPAFNLNTYISSTLDNTYTPGWPSPAESLAAFGNGPSNGATGSNTRVRDAVERPMGWGSFSDVNLDGIIEQNEVTTPVHSLLDKAKTAQLVFDNKFLSPFAPSAPAFYLVPGDNKVSVLWKKSTSETDGVGDPYFAVASNAASALYDPNYRQFDVEGYRVWRGRTKAEMVLLAQFDYQGTTMLDYTGNLFDPLVYGDPTQSTYQCAPELGITASCPGFPYAFPLVGNVIQIRTGGRQALADGSVVITTADTAVTGGGNPNNYPPLRDNFVPFAYVDATARNGFQYFYAVTAFDINSFNSGPSSQQSAMVTQSVTPHASNGQESLGSLGTLQELGADGTVLNPSAALPTLDATTGEFSGPMPPANGAGLGFMAFVPSVVASGSGSLTVTVDSVLGGQAFLGIPGTYWIHLGNGTNLAVPMPYELTTGVDTALFAFPAQANNQSKAARFGGDSTYAFYGNFPTWHDAVYPSGGWGRGWANAVFGLYNGPRWWSGSANENTVNPLSGICDVYDHSAAVCSNGTAGVLPGVDSLFRPGAYSTVNSQPMRQMEGMTAGVHRAADFAVYWNATTAGVVDSVMDLSNHVPVPFKKTIQASWGILTDSSFLGSGSWAAVNAAHTQDKKNILLTLSDIYCVPPAPRNVSPAYGAAVCGGGTDSAFFMNHADLSPIAARGGTYAGTATVAGTGTGFIFYLNGDFFLMQMTTLPKNVVWYMRDYVGGITGVVGTYAFVSGVRPIVPGLVFKISFTGSVASKASVDSTFSKIHTVPDPYYVTNSLETSANFKVLRFVNLPSQCIVRIYSASGILIRVLTHNDPGNGSELQWDLRNRNNQFVASGVYFYHVEAADGRTKVGRFTVVNFAQ